MLSLGSYPSAYVFDSRTRYQTRASPRVQPDRVCCINIVSIRIIGNDLTRCWSVTVNHKMGGSNPLLPAKQMLTDQLLGQLERCKRLAEDMWFDSIRQHQLRCKCFISRKRYGSVLCLERSGGGSTPPRVTNFTVKVAYGLIPKLIVPATSTTTYGVGVEHLAVDAIQWAYSVNGNTPCLQLGVYGSSPYRSTKL